MTEEWYYFQDGNQAGPVSESTVHEMLRSGRLRWDAFVWHDGLPDWLAAEQIPALAALRVMPDAPAAPLPPPFNSLATPIPPAPQAFVAPVPLRVGQPVTPAPILTPQPTFGVGGVSAGTLAILAKTRPWVRFLGVLAFAGCLLLVLFGFAGLVFGIMGGGGGFAGIGIGLAALAAYIIVAGLVFPAGLFLSRFAKAIRVLQTSQREEDLQAALLAQKSYWKYLGIMTLVGLAFSILGTAAALIFGIAGYFTAS